MNRGVGVFAGKQHCKGDEGRVTRSSVGIRTGNSGLIILGEDTVSDEVRSVDDILAGIGPDGIYDGCEVYISDSKKNCKKRNDG